ncbi:CGNR zinc finger domain-containing protein [Lentzea sp. NPDC003310]|uniref:CGNR zinc finger domain-containing protein n=1 Tax=Lentzea sp. NPDC003310 TaxID=3154447 RepID=UPI0033AE98C3
MLLDLLNTTPVLDDGQHDVLAEEGPDWLAAHGQPASGDELRALTAARDALQAVVRGQEQPAALAPFVEGVGQRAGVDSTGVTWQLDLPAGRTAAARAVLEWDALRVASPGRLRPCANPDCRLFLLDQSKPNSARWCSMAVCGNRMKARRHYQRTRGGQ